MVGIAPSLKVFFPVPINIKDTNIFNNGYLRQNSKNSLITSSSNKNKSVYTFFLTFVD